MLGFCAGLSLLCSWQPTTPCLFARCVYRLQITLTSRGMTEGICSAGHVLFFARQGHGLTWGRVRDRPSPRIHWRVTSLPHSHVRLERRRRWFKTSVRALRKNQCKKCCCLLWRGCCQKHWLAVKAHVCVTVASISCSIQSRTLLIRA